MLINQKDKTILRQLAKQVVEIAELPIMAERRELWKRHNSLERVRPMILIFPEGSWRELLPQSALKCETPAAQGMERNLRMRLYHHEHLYDDTVIENEWVVSKAVRTTGWGLEAQHVQSTASTGAWGFDPVIKTHRDLEKLKFPEVSHDAEATQRHLETAQELFGEILDVIINGSLK